ncbi:MAG: beta-ketoacyl-[acyl-carrier-protein] synthase family protein [Lentisphaerota bacterium]
MIRKNRVVITGLGALAANGIGVDAFWRSLLAGSSGIGPVTFFDATALPCRIAGEIKSFDPFDYIPSDLKPSRMARFAQLALVASQMALKDAVLSVRDMQGKGPLPIVMGVSTSSMEMFEEQYQRMLDKGPRHVNVHAAPSFYPQAAAVTMAAYLGLETRLMTLSTGCPAGLDAIAAAAALIREGKAELALAGGVDTPITLLTMACFCAARMVSRRNDEPAKASRPFDRDRDGGLLAEGVGIVVLENLNHALARGATIYAEVTGYGSQTDQAGTSPGSAFPGAISQAVANASHYPQDIDFVCAHGSSDVELDRAETAALKSVMGSKAYGIPVTSIKGATGNPLAAAGPLQVITAALGIRHGKVPPTANYEAQDPSCDLDYVSGKARSGSFGCVLVNNHGFGGANSSLLMERVAVE